MGTVYKESYTKPLPSNAEVITRKGERVAKWIDRRGRKRTARVTTGRDGTPRILIESGTYTAKYRDGSGHVVKVTTGCRTRDAARAVLTELQTRGDKVRSGLRSAAEDSTLDHQTAPIAGHVADYLDYLKHKTGKGCKLKVALSHVAGVTQQLKRLVAECGFGRLRDLNRNAAERWADKCEAEGAAGKTVNLYLGSLTAFGNWCVETGRITANPFARLPKRDERTNRKRQRRALTEAELGRLLQVARLRPVAEYGRERIKPADSDGKPNPKSRRTWKRAPLAYADLESATDRGRHALRDRPDYLAMLDRRGRERALVYKTLVLTGLRKGELAALCVRHLELDGPTAYVVLEAADEKAGRGADIPLRADLAADLRAWLTDQLEAARNAARAKGEPIPATLPPDTPILDVPTGLVRILDRDLQAAGIPKCDDRGRTVDVHALRHTFGTHLSKGGVAPRTAQAAMRHSVLDLTMNTYTDPRLLDVAGALDVLPRLPLDGGKQSQRQRATGTAGPEPVNASRRGEQADNKADSAARKLVPMLVPTTRNRCISQTLPDKSLGDDRTAPTAVSACVGKSSVPVSTCGTLEPSGHDPPTSWLQTRRSPN